MASRSRGGRWHACQVAARREAGTPREQACPDVARKQVDRRQGWNARRSGSAVGRRAHHRPPRRDSPGVAPRGAGGTRVRRACSSVSAAPRRRAFRRRPGSRRSPRRPAARTRSPPCCVRHRRRGPACGSPAGGFRGVAARPGSPRAARHTAGGGAARRRDRGRGSRGRRRDVAWRGKTYSIMAPLERAKWTFSWYQSRAMRGA